MLIQGSPLGARGGGHVHCVMRACLLEDSNAFAHRVYMRDYHTFDSQEITAVGIQRYSDVNNYSGYRACGGWSAIILLHLQQCMLPSLLLHLN